MRRHLAEWINNSFYRDGRIILGVSGSEITPAERRTTALPPEELQDLLARAVAEFSDPDDGSVEPVDDADTATTLSNLAGLLQVQGDYAAAELLYRRALAISETTLGPDHRDTAISLNNVARLLEDLGDHAAAEPLRKTGGCDPRPILGPVILGRRRLALLTPNRPIAMLRMCKASPSAARKARAR